MNSKSMNAVGFTAKVIMIQCAILLFPSCEEPDMATVSYPSYGYPGPKSEVATTYSIVDDGACDADPTSENAQRWCVDDIENFNSSGCGYNQIVKFCSATWAKPENADKMKSKIRGCQMVFRTAKNTYFLDQQDLEEANIDEYCSEKINTKLTVHTWRFSAASDGSSSSPATGYPYQGQYINEAKSVRVKIVNWSNIVPPKDFENRVQSNVLQILANFDYEIWNYLDVSNGRLISFPVPGDIAVNYIGKAEDNASVEGVYRYRCPEFTTPSDINCDMNPRDGVAGQYYLDRSGFEVDRDGNYGVSKTKININVIIVDGKYSMRIGNQTIAMNDGGIIGEINKSPDAMGFVIWYYASDGTISQTVMAHEIGHALLRHHEDGNISREKGISDFMNGLMLPAYPGTRTSPEVPAIRPFMSVTDGLNISGMPGAVSLFVDHLLIWPTAEGQVVKSGAEMNKNEKGGK